MTFPTERHVFIAIHGYFGVRVFLFNELKGEWRGLFNLGLILFIITLHSTPPVLENVDSSHNGCCCTVCSSIHFLSKARLDKIPNNTARLSCTSEALNIKRSVISDDQFKGALCNIFAGCKQTKKQIQETVVCRS